MFKNISKLCSIITLTTILFACLNKNNNNSEQVNAIDKHVEPVIEIIEQEVDTLIIDSNLTLEEAIKGTKAPQHIIDELVIIDVQYLSTDDKIHQGQIVTNKKLEADIKHIFQYMLANSFVIEKAIPIVVYNWSDSLSMDDNNTYSFCYRNASYSKHAQGTAIDINPRFNPLRWKLENRPNQPEGAILDTTINGTLHPKHIVVEEFKRLGYKWGHTFTKYYDDHHFEKR